jgi:SAM-dependent methyltransferase
MGGVNEFATQHGLRTFYNWSKIWEYPWLWYTCLHSVNWHETTLLDLGSEKSPMPWILATLGAKVILVEVDPQWVPFWDRLRRELMVDVNWFVANSEQLPVADASVDVVTSFSVVEHQLDKARAIEEVTRVLKRNGLLAISFDVCEPELGMTFPTWNGRALTLSEFESIIWFHPAFGNSLRPLWNREDIPAFKEWHLKSAPHHNYVVGGAVLRKTSG